jgi:hypothetical protein
MKVRGSKTVRPRPAQCAMKALAFFAVVDLLETVFNGEWAGAVRVGGDLGGGTGHQYPRP